jgi:hypothetical protein
MLVRTLLHLYWLAQHASDTCTSPTQLHEQPSLSSRKVNRQIHCAIFAYYCIEQVLVVTGEKNDPDSR